MNEQKRGIDVLPWALLALILIGALLAWQFFPVLQSAINHNDCVATGRTNCL